MEGRCETWKIELSSRSESGGGNSEPGNARAVKCCGEWVVSGNHRDEVRGKHLRHGEPLEELWRGLEGKGTAGDLRLG